MPATRSPRLLAATALAALATALPVAAPLLGHGDSSRLNLSIGYRAQIAQTASFAADLRVGTGLLVAYAIAATGATPETLAYALRKEVAKLANAPVPATELAKVKTQLVTQALVERQTPLGKGMALGEAIIARGDARRANDELAELQAVTPADVQRVVRKYLTGASQVTIEYTQQAAAKDGAGRPNVAIPAGGAK